MSGPVLRVTTERGDVWDDPSELRLFDLLTEVERGDEEFFVMERTDDPSGETYIQVRLDEEGLVVEHRDGGPDRHFQAITADKRLVHEVLTSWALGRPGWRTAIAWQPLVL